jgi:proteic killer suppression protein
MWMEFADKGTEDIYDGLDSKPARKTLPRYLHEKARRKLSVMAYAESLDDLRAPPSNHLERLRGDRDGQYSIRIDGQFRVCFRWAEGTAIDIEIVDYH